MKTFFHQWERIFLIAIFFLTLSILMVLVRGDQTYPHVIQSYPAEGNLPLSTKQITLTFNRMMDEASVEKNFKIHPFVEGKFSWIGKHMAYSFNQPLEGDQAFSVELTNAQDKLGNKMKEIYKKDFTVAKQTLYFIGSEGEGKSRLIAYLPETGIQQILTPKEMIIKDFWVHSGQERLFLLTEGEKSEHQHLYELNLSTRQMRQMLNGEKEKLFAFKLSPDGKKAAIRRGKRNEQGGFTTIDPGSIFLYDIATGTSTLFWNKEIYGNDYYFSSDSAYLIGRTIAGDISVFPLNEGDVTYLGGYEGHHILSPDGNKIAFVDDQGGILDAHDLLLRKQDGSTEILLEKEGQINFPVFSQSGDDLYFLMNQPDSGIFNFSSYHLYKYDLIKQSLIQLTQDDDYFEGFFSLSSDSAVIVMERYKTKDRNSFFDWEEDNKVPTAELWLYDNEKGSFSSLGMKGTKPHLN